MVFTRQNLKCLTVENLRPSFEKLCLLDQETLKSVKVPILCCSLINYTLVYQIFEKILFLIPETQNHFLQQRSIDKSQNAVDQLSKAEHW